MSTEVQEKKHELEGIVTDYKYGFKTEYKNLKDTGKGISEDVVREISAIKGEPEWMLEYRLKAYAHFAKTPMPEWGPDLSEINFDDYTYYIKPSEKTENSWEDVPDEIKDTFDKLGIPEAEAKFLSGVSTQYESEVVYHNNQKELEEAGVIFMDTDSALREYPDLFKEYFGKVIPYADNKFAALNSAVWSGGSFIYVPKGVKLDKPLQSYFRINSEKMGQFERTLIIVDDDADIHYIEGCTAPLYAKDSLHAGVVEIIVKKRAHMRYSTIQNWSTNVLNLVTQRATVDEDGSMEWVDGNIGSHLNMKYPCCILKGERAKGSAISIASGSKGQFQDNGAKMIHLAPYTSSNIVSKSICRLGGRVNYRGLVDIKKKALHAKSKVSCDTLLLDDLSGSDTFPTNIIENTSSTIEHEASVSKISEEQLYYLMSRGLSEEEATRMIVLGFIEPFTRELPMEYAVELNQLLKMNMEGSIG